MLECAGQKVFRDLGWDPVSYKNLVVSESDLVAPAEK